jgi:hypothetical protein
MVQRCVLRILFAQVRKRVLEVKDMNDMIQPEVDLKRRSVNAFFPQTLKKIANKDWCKRKVGFVIIA